MGQGSARGALDVDGEAERWRPPMPMGGDWRSASGIVMRGMLKWGR